MWPVHTVLFSNHTEYPSWRGPVISATDVSQIIKGVDELGVLGQVDAILTGYQGSQEIGQAILDSVELVKKQNPAALFCADPVLGDFDCGFFADPGVQAFTRDHVAPIADVLAPNLFELQYLTGRTTRTLADVLAAADQLRERGPSVVLITSVTADDLAPGVIWMIAVTEEKAVLVQTPLIEQDFVGCGDLTSSMFLTHWMRTHDLAEALSMTASVVYSVLDATARSGQQELQLVASQEEIVAPSHRFETSVLR